MKPGLPQELKDIINQLTDQGLNATQVTDQMVSDGHKVNYQQVLRVAKKRNQHLTLVKEKAIELVAKPAAEAHLKSLKMLNKKLDRADRYDEDLKKVEDAWFNSGQTAEDKAMYNARLRALERVTIPELVQVAKETFNQSRVEEGKPTAIVGTSGNPEDDKRLEELSRAIKNGDQIELQRILFTPAND